jgi:hypothetical protein
MADDLPNKCTNCHAPLCKRKQVINLALGNTDTMMCLVCLGKENGKSPEAVLLEIKDYVLSRNCFRKPWSKYTCQNDCPNPDTCFPVSCFAP